MHINCKMHAHFRNVQCTCFRIEKTHAFLLWEIGNSKHDKALRVAEGGSLVDVTCFKEQWLACLSDSGVGRLGRVAEGN